MIDGRAREVHAVRLRRARNFMLRQAGEARARAEAEARLCEREAERLDQELARLGHAPGPGCFEFQAVGGDDE